LSLFRRAALWARDEQTKNARAHASSHHGFSSEDIRTRKATAKKGGGISARTIRFAAGYCAAGFIFLMLVFLGFTAITSLDVPAGVSSYSPMPSSITQAVSSESTQPAIETGNELFNAGDYEGALRMYDAVVAKNPDLTQKEVWYNRGIAQNALGHYRDASQSFDYVLALSPGDSLALANLGQQKEARAAFDNARILPSARSGY
jgi:tetratricopeptide (TPR) repeat protein